MERGLLAWACQCIWCRTAVHCTSTHNKTHLFHNANSIHTTRSQQYFQHRAMRKWLFNNVVLQSYSTIGRKLPLAILVGTLDRGVDRVNKIGSGQRAKPN